MAVLVLFVVVILKRETPLVLSRIFEGPGNVSSQDMEEVLEEVLELVLELFLSSFWDAKLFYKILQVFQVSSPSHGGMYGKENHHQTIKTNSSIDILAPYKEFLIKSSSLIGTASHPGLGPSKGAPLEGPLKRAHPPKVIKHL